MKLVVTKYTQLPIHRSDAFIGNCLFNTISRFASLSTRSLNNQNNNQYNNCQQQQKLVVSAGDTWRGAP